MSKKTWIAGGFALGMFTAVSPAALGMLNRANITVWTPTQTLTADDLNDNFDELATAIEALEDRDWHSGSVQTLGTGNHVTAFTMYPPDGVYKITAFRDTGTKAFGEYWLSVSAGVCTFTNGDQNTAMQNQSINWQCNDTLQEIRVATTNGDPNYYFHLHRLD